jgi:murein L,D-transpeptidase YcbB/YkuD
VNPRAAGPRSSARSSSAAFRGARRAAAHALDLSALKKALEQYRAIAAAGGWQSLRTGRRRSPGRADPRLAALERRLAVEGDLASPPRASSAAYDSVLVAR